ncbi:MAG: DUF998 domain-containing protein [Verrucomicrobiota bacterium]|jgi:hypothetical membrane protein
MQQHTSPRFCGSCVVAGTLLSLIAMVALHLLRPGFNPWRNFLSEYAVGPFGFLVAAGAGIMAATFLMLLLGLRLSVHPSGFLTASCVLLGVVILSLCVCALFPLDLITSPDGSRPTRAALLAALTKTDITHIVASVLLFLSLMALMLTLPGAYKRDEQWRSFSQTTLFLGFLFLAFLLGLILAPFHLKGLIQRGMFLVILIWLLLTGLRLRQAGSSAFGTSA